MLTPTCRSLVAYFTLAGLTLTGCGGGHSQPQATKHPSSTAAIPTASPSTSPSAPVPNYTVDQVLHRLLSAKDVGPDFNPTVIGTRALLDHKVLMCSLSGVKLPGNPTIGERQYGASVNFRYDRNYNQFIALYSDQTQASQAFSTLKAAALACPPKQHVPAQQDATSTATLLEHDDTWTLGQQDTLQGWTHLHGWEREVNPPDQTGHNVYFDAYDYILRGNLVLGTLYDERTDPADSGKAIQQRASEVLTKQLLSLK